MTKILFLCHGNICRSPMAEFVMKHLIRSSGRNDICVESAALHCDEIGSEAEIYSISQALRLGVPIIATVHAETVNDIKERKPLVKIIKTGGIKRIIFLEGPENAGKIKETVKTDDIFN